VSAAHDAVAIVMVVRDEPLDRVQRAVDALAAQRDVAPFVVVIAAPGGEHASLRALRVGGAVHEIVLVDNPDGARCAGLNLAVAHADAELLVRVDARSRVHDDHVARCVERLTGDDSVGVVGGVQWPVAVDEDVAGRATVRALRNRWLLGNAGYRRPGAAGPVDTVYLGAFRRAELHELGGYDERLAANEDFELCARYRDAGRIVWLEDGLLVDYEPRSGVAGVFDQYRAFGEAKVEFWRATGRRPNARQWIALGAAAGAVLAVLASLRRPRRVVALVATGVVAVVVADHLSDPGERDVRVRARSCATSIATTSGWLAGVLTGLARGVRRRVR
jgi:hypothetical protein